MRDELCAVSPQGDRITITLPDRAGVPRAIELSFDEASALMMTLPRLLRLALGRRFNDDSLRHVYALKQHSVEFASDWRHLLLTLSAAEGFEVTFAVNAETTPSLASDLIDGSEQLGMPKPIRSN